MKLHINDKIKDLRKAQKWTQEELAERLNVSPQAVSRWETNATFPDIELLPDIASVFEISVDELLGVNDLLNNDRIKKLIDEANSYYDTNEVDKVVTYLEQAKKEYPANINITLNLILALSALYSEDRSALYSEDRRETCERIIELGTKIADRLTDINDKYKLYQIMAYTHVELGNIEQAKIYANKLPDMEYTSNIVLTSIIEGNDKIKLIQENIQSLLNTIIMQISYLVNVANYTNNEQITILKKIDGLIELMYEKGDYVYKNWLLCGNNMNITEIYAKLKDEKNTCLYLAKAVAYSKKMGKNESSSLLNNVLEQDFEKTFGKTFEKDEINMILTRVKDNVFDFVRETQEFKKIIESIK